jgi:8-oxo-dGTP pyrophosphatase MutT (NUDIX family)
MTKEKSCGAVVFTKMNNEIKFIIEEMNLGHFALPKGHVELNENEIDTARREIKEETNLDVTFLSSFREVSSYSPKKNVVKDVVYFLAEAKCINDLKRQESEVHELFLLNFDEADRVLTYDSDRLILKHANDYLTNMK